MGDIGKGVPFGGIPPFSKTERTMQTRSQSRGVQKPVTRHVVTLPAAALLTLVDRGVVREYEGAFLLVRPGAAEERCLLEAAVEAETAKEQRVRALLADVIARKKEFFREELNAVLECDVLYDLHALALNGGAEVLVDFGDRVRAWARAGAYDEGALRVAMQQPVFWAIGAAGLKALLPSAEVEVTGSGVAVKRTPGAPRAEIRYAKQGGKMMWGADLLRALEGAEKRAGVVV